MLTVLIKCTVEPQYKVERKVQIMNLICTQLGMAVGIALLHLGGFTVKFFPGFSIQAENTHGLMRRNTITNYTVYNLSCRQYLQIHIDFLKQILSMKGWARPVLNYRRTIHWYILVCTVDWVGLLYVSASLL